MLKGAYYLMLYCIIIPAACKGVFSHFCTTRPAVGGAVCYTDNNYEKTQKPQEEMTVKQSLNSARRLAALVLAAVMLQGKETMAFVEDAAPGAIGRVVNTTLIPEEEENCLSWLFGSKDVKITLPYRTSACLPERWTWNAGGHQHRCSYGTAAVAQRRSVQAAIHST